MKTNRLLPGNSALAALIVCLLAMQSLQAQTFNGRRQLMVSPTSFDAVVYPLSNRISTIKVTIDNISEGSVRVLIRNNHGVIFYDELDVMERYRQCFDLSSLPEGIYTVELSKRNELYTQAFTINPPAQPQSQIVLLNPPYQKDGDKPAEKKLVVRQ